MQDFIQPDLTKNGTPGGSDYAMYVKGNTYDSGNYIYGILSTTPPQTYHRFCYANAGPVFYSPYPLSIRIWKFYCSTYYNNTIKVKVSNDGNTWYKKTSTSTKDGSAATTYQQVITISNPGYWHYWWIYQTDTNWYYYGSGASLPMTLITGKVIVEMKTYPWAADHESHYFIKY